jgi:hypothetical protein
MSSRARLRLACLLSPARGRAQSRINEQHVDAGQKRPHTTGTCLEWIFR